MTFAQAIAEERRRLNLSMEEFAALFGQDAGHPRLVSPTARKWETGERTPPLWAQWLILEFLQSVSTNTEGRFNKRGPAAKGK